MIKQFPNEGSAYNSLAYLYMNYKKDMPMAKKVLKATLLYITVAATLMVQWENITLTTAIILMADVKPPSQRR